MEAAIRFDPILAMSDYHPLKVANDRRYYVPSNVASDVLPSSALIIPKLMNIWQEEFSKLELGSGESEGQVAHFRRLMLYKTRALYIAELDDLSCFGRLHTMFRYWWIKNTVIKTRDGVAAGLQSELQRSRDYQMMAFLPKHSVKARQTTWATFY